MDQFLHGSSVAAAHVGIRMGFLRKVFGILSVQLLFTTIIGAIFLFTPGVKGLVQQWTWMLMIGLILSFVLLFAMMIKRHETPTNYILLAAWTVCEAYLVGVLVSFYDQFVVLEAFFLTCCVVFALFAYTLQTNRDFTGYGPALFACVWILVIAGLLQMFLLSDTFELLLSVGGAIVFSLFIIFDIQMMMTKLSPEEYIMATMNLYLDILNLFLYILRFLNEMRRQ